MTNEEAQEFINQCLKKLKSRRKVKVVSASLAIDKYDFDFEDVYDYDLTQNMSYYHKKRIIITANKHNEIFTKEEIRSILAHELGHAFDKRIVKDYYEITKKQKHNMEYYADKFALKFVDKSTLVSGLMKGYLYAGIGLKISTCTHPSLYNRILKIQNANVKRIN